METTKPAKDLQPFKNSLMSLTYEEKIQMSEWLHTQIDLERGEYVKQKGKEVTEQIGKFADKAAQVTKTAGNSLMDQFKKATGNEPQ
jgi:hypothetical protein